MEFDLTKIYLFKNENLYVTEYEIKLRVEALKELISDDENSISKIQDDLTNFFKNIKSKKIPIEQKDVFENHLIDRELIIGNLILQKRYSTCLLMFAVFEGILKEICQEIEAKNDSKIKVSDLNGRDLSRYKKYLTKVFEINFSKIEPSFTRLTQQKITRNKIAHENGFLKKSNEIHVVQGLSIKHRRINIEGKNYFDYLIQNIEKFFEQLLIGIDEKTTKNEIMLPNMIK